MKRIVGKYNLSITGTSTVLMGKNSNVVSVAVQHGQLVMYAVGSTHRNTVIEARTFISLFTGEEIPEDAVVEDFIGTLMHEGGNLVLHVFEVKNKDK